MNESRFTFAWNVHQYLTHFIQFADTKAAFVFAWCNGVIVLLAERNFLTPLFVLTKWVNQPVIQLLAFSSLVLLSLGIGLAVLVIYPVLKSKISIEPKPLNGSQGLIYWEDICSLCEQDYVARLGNGDELIESVARHCYTLAAIAKRKYTLLKASTIFGLVGSFCALVTLAFKTN
jgi:hypothetical protein